VNLVYENNRYRATDCPICRQEVQVDKVGAGFRFVCRGGHTDEELRPQLSPQVMLELAGANGARPVPPSDNGATVQHPPRERVDGAELLEEIRAFLTKYMVLPSAEVADLLAVWTVHTHAIEVAYATPYLRITSATRECGKTVLLEILATLTARGWHAVNPSAAVLYRKIDRQQPTLLLDEMDNFPLDDRRDALAVLNAGYKRGATIDRCKENGDLESFSAYCAKAYAGIDERRLVDTLLSRSITIRLEKRLPSDAIDPWIGQDCEEPAESLRDRAQAWAEQNMESLGPRPALPGSIVNRAAEVWRPLLAIADRVGADWPTRTRRAAVNLATGGDAADEQDGLVLLLADIREAFGKATVISTAHLLTFLNGLDESPWGARRRGEGLDARGLARLLRPFKIRPRSVRAEGGSKGYHLEQFEDAFARHLQEAAQAAQAAHSAQGLEPDVPDVPNVPDKSPRPCRAEEDGEEALAPPPSNGHHPGLEEYAEAEIERLAAKWGAR
jgi:hypothetical protein